MNNKKSRLKILIGKNGSGKSRMLTSLLKREFKRAYSGEKDAFDRILAVSIAPFDKFPISLSDPRRKYRYLGLKNTSGSTAAKKFIKKIGVDFFEMLDAGEDWMRISYALNEFGLSSRVKFDIRVSGRLKKENVDHYNSDEFNAYVFNEFLKENPWEKISKSNRTNDVFYSFSKLQRFLMDKSSYYYGDSSWSISINNNELNRDSLFYDFSYRDISILLASGLLEISRINIYAAGQEIDLCSASSGEQSVYLTLIGIAANLRAKSLVLIDEPETCLHPEWQEKYISIIDIFLKSNPDCYFWIATHSPKIVSGAMIDAEIIDVESNRIFGNNEFNKKSSDYQLVELFNSPGYKNEYVSRLVLDAISLMAESIGSSDGLINVVNKLKKIYPSLHADDPLKEVIGAIERSMSVRVVE